MGILSKFKNLILQGDLFYSSQILKFNSDTTYKTCSGAIFSLVIIAAVIFGFSSMIISTLEKTKLNSTLEVTKQSQNPSRLNLKTGEDHFMFGVYIQSMEKDLKIFDLTNGPQVFNLDSIQLEYENGVGKKFTRLSMVPCTKEHWHMMPQMIDNFEAKNINKWMCPPLNTSIIIQGNPTSKYYKILSIKLESCKNSTLNNNNCASQSIIDQTFTNYTNFFLRINILNPVINPNQPQHIKYYLQEQNRVIFSKLSGVQMIIQLSDFTIDTDNSVLPYASINSQSGYIIQNKGHNYPYSISNGFILANILITKSPNILTYTRQVIKISEVFSYIGGLVGAITAFMFMFKSYTETALQMNISLDLFKQKPDPQNLQYKNPRFSFNFINYISFNLYKFLRFFNKGSNFIIAQKMQMYQDEIEKQLDIKILLQRIIKLESCMGHIFDENQIQGIRNSEEITYERAIYLRTLLHQQEQEGSKKQIDSKNIGADKDKKESQKGGEAQQNIESQLSGIGVLPFSPNIMLKQGRNQRQSQHHSIRNPQFMKSIKILKENADKSDVKKKILKDLRRQLRQDIQSIDLNIPSLKFYQKQPQKL